MQLSRRNQQNVAGLQTIGNILNSHEKFFLQRDDDFLRVVPVGGKTAVLGIVPESESGFVHIGSELIFFRCIILGEAGKFVRLYLISLFLIFGQSK